MEDNLSLEIYINKMKDKWVWFIDSWFLVAAVWHALMLSDVWCVIGPGICTSGGGHYLESQSDMEAALHYYDLAQGLPVLKCACTAI